MTADIGGLDPAALAIGLGQRRRYRTSCGLHQLFEDSVDRAPDATAVIDADVEWTYAQLETRANRIAARVAERGYGIGSRIGICLPRSAWVAEALLGVLKSGGVCVPLDPSYPPARLADMVSDAAISAVLTTPELAVRLPDARDTVLVEARASVEEGGPARPVTPLPPGALAYLIYTSGSTGRPKAVMVSHAGLVNHAQAAVELYELSSADRILQISSISFDISVEEMFPTWAAGGTVVYRPDNAAVGGREFLTDLARHRITVLDLPTALWSQWTADLERRDERPPSSLRAVIVGGEKARSASLAAWRRLDGGSVRWFNTYGPSEASVIATAWEAPRMWDPGTDVPLGRPIPNVDIYLLADDGRPGMSGEVGIAGMGVALGYLGLQELSAEKFVPHPFGGVGRLYRTGDLAAWNADRTLAYRGRIDDQVKIRGFRVEPEEVTAALLSHPDVAEAAVTAAAGRDQQWRLVAYTVPRPRTEADEAALLVHLAKRLPSYMVPSAFVRLESLPLTPNGKVDTAALPSPPRAQRRLTEPPGRPRDAVEEMLVGLWRDILDLDEVGIHDDFFDIGGYSIAAAWMLGELESHLGHLLPMADFLQQPTIERLGSAIAEGVAASTSCVQPVQTSGSLAPLIYVCSGEAGVFALRHLAKSLGPDQPIYALVLRRLPAFDRADATVEELVSGALPEIDDAVPAESRVLLGYSVGGLVAYEMAVRLLARGERVPLVVLLDTWFPGAPRRRVRMVRTLVRRSRSVLKRGRLGPLPKLRGAFGTVVPGSTTEAGAPSTDPASDGGAAVDEPDHVGEMYWRYRPEVLGTRMLLARTGWAISMVGDKRLGWSRRLVREFRTVDVPGDHGTIMREPNVHSVIDSLREELLRIPVRGPTSHLAAISGSDRTAQGRV